MRRLKQVQTLMQKSLIGHNIHNGVANSNPKQNAATIPSHIVSGNHFLTIFYGA